MADRALIIAIENYDLVTEGFTARKLEGTLKAATAFREWLEDKWREEGVTGTVLFCSEPKLPGQFGAGSADIIEALIELEKGRDTTDNLFVYFSGHGFRATGETIKLADVLVCADFKDLQRGAASCFKLDALIAGLRESLGRGCHFYFIDACRNEVPRAVMSSIMPFSGRGSEEPSVFVLQSTAAGAPALVAGPFARMLVQGLRGAGKAKVWDPPIVDSMKVRFDSLRKFLKDGLQNIQPITQTTSGEKGESDAVLATIAPVVPSRLTLTINAPGVALAGSARIAAFGGAPVDHLMNGSSLIVDLPPNFYTVTLSVVGRSVTPAGPVTADLFENRELAFVLDERRAGRVAHEDGAGLEAVEVQTPRGGSRPPVHVDVPPGALLELKHVGTGQESTFDSPTLSARLGGGTYRTTLRKPGGHVISVGEVTIGESAAEIALAAWQGDVVRESIARHFPQRDGGIDFSEALGGAIADPDLGVWLAIIGGGRVLGSSGDYSKIGALPMADFSTEPAGASPLYVLAELPDARSRFGVAVGNGSTRPVWVQPTRPPGLEGVREAVIRRPPGQWFVTLGIGGQPTYTLTSFAMANRCTLIVVTLDEDEQPRIGQYLLPIGHLTAQLHPRVQQLLVPRNQLRDVQVLALLSRAFRKRRRIGDEFKANELHDLLESKWLDPIGIALAAYESVRRNRSAPSALFTAARNMHEYFRDLPDTAAIVRLAGALVRPDGVPVDPPGRAHVPVGGVPLFLDGLRAFADGDVTLPYPAALLNFTGPWTSWRGAV